jgi:hypothetical protein
LAIDVARVQAHPKPCGIADLPAWNWAAKIRQRSDGAFRGLDFRRKRDRHIANRHRGGSDGGHRGGAETAAAHGRTDAFAVQSAPRARTDRASSDSDFERQNAKPRYWSGATVHTWGSLPRAMLSRGRRGVDIEAGLDGMTSPMANNGVDDPALYPPQRPAQPSATDAAAPEHMRMRRSPPQKTAAPVRGHAGGI